MSTLENQPIKDTYKKLLQVSGSTNTGATAALKTIETGDGVSTVLQVSTSKVKVAGDLEVTGSVAGLTDGADGADGADGVSVTGASVNSSGQLVLTLSSGSTINAGVVKGADGTDGTNGTDGASAPTISDATITSTNHLELSMSDGSTIDAGVIISNVTSPSNLPGIYANSTQQKLSDNSLINQVAIGDPQMYLEDIGQHGLQTSPTGNFYPTHTLYVKGGTKQEWTTWYTNMYPGIYNRILQDYRYFPNGGANMKGFYGDRPNGGSSPSVTLDDGRSVYPLDYLRNLHQLLDSYYYIDYETAVSNPPSDGSDSYRRQNMLQQEFASRFIMDTDGADPDERRGQALYEMEFSFIENYYKINEANAGFFVFPTERTAGLLWDPGHVSRPSAITPNGFGNLDLGSSKYEFRDLFLKNAPTVSSDRNIKQNIEDLSEAELQTAQAVKSLVKKYKYKTAVEDKGDNARTHFGVIAQDIVQAFSDNGLDCFDYGIVCKKEFYECWRYENEKDGESFSFEEPEGIDDESVGVQRKKRVRFSADPKIDGVVKQTEYSVRYEELFAFIISAL